jgi:hypothetical protein
MKKKILKEQAENRNGFILNVELKELSTNGVVRFYSKKNDTKTCSFWNDKKLIIPVHGIYKIDWGFHKNSISRYCQNYKTELALVINNRLHAEKAKIAKKVTDVHPLKYYCQTLTLLLQEADTLSLHAEMFNAKSLNMIDVYLKVSILESEEKKELNC